MSLLSYFDSSDTSDILTLPLRRLKIESPILLNRETTIMIVSNYLVFFLFVANNAMASNLVADLSVLDESINLGQTCDIVRVSHMARTNFNTKVQVGDEIVRGTFSVTLDAAQHLKKETFAFSKCLILVTLDYIPMYEVVKLGKRLQFFKPLAFFQYKSKISQMMK